VAQVGIDRQTGKQFITFKYQALPKTRRSQHLKPSYHILLSSANTRRFEHEFQDVSTCSSLGQSTFGLGLLMSLGFMSGVKFAHTSYTDLPIRLARSPQSDPTQNVDRIWIFNRAGLTRSPPMRSNSTASATSSGSRSWCIARSITSGEYLYLNASRRSSLGRAGVPHR